MDNENTFSMSREHLEMLQALVARQERHTLLSNDPVQQLIGRFYWTPINLTLYGAIRDTKDGDVHISIPLQEQVDISNTEITEEEVRREIARMVPGDTPSTVGTGVPVPASTVLRRTAWSNCKVCGTRFSYQQERPVGSHGWGRSKSICSEECRLKRRLTIAPTPKARRPNPALRTLVALAADGAKGKEISEKLNMDILAVARGIRSQRPFIDELKALKPYDPVSGKSERYEYLQKNYGMGLPKEEREALATN